MKEKTLKHKLEGETIEIILEVDAKYIQWCCKHISSFHINKEARQVLSMELESNSYMQNETAKEMYNEFGLTPYKF